MAALAAARKRADKAWDRLVALNPDEGDDDFPPPPEQAAADAIWAELWAVAEHDRWPKHLYFTV